ncbi:MAG: YceI family protein [Verrucomicrobiota bacterium]|nr:YceI family protein [Verrucomicrobiota bacterium]
MKILWLKIMFLFFGCVASIHSMTFDLAPLGSKSRIEINLSTGFGSGSIRGSIDQVRGKIDMIVETPENMDGAVLLDARKIRFGYGKVDHDAHKVDWLHSTQYPRISFEMNGLDKIRWAGRVLNAEAKGSLTLKGKSSNISLPVSIRYLRAQRRKFDGRSGDILLLNGELLLSRKDFGINPGGMLDSIMDEIRVKVTIYGCSDKIRPFLPSPLFGRGHSF